MIIAYKATYNEAMTKLAEAQNSRHSHQMINFAKEI